MLLKVNHNQYEASYMFPLLVAKDQHEDLYALTACFGQYWSQWFNNSRKS